MGHKSAFISIVGRPNTGKSTLINALVGEAIAITSHHPNTTRRAIRGIVTREYAQLIFVDTPGMHKPRTALGGALNSIVDESMDSVDVIIQCIPIDESVGAGDLHVARQIATHPGARKIAVVTKMDKSDRARAPEQLMRIKELAETAGFSWDEVIPISAQRGEQIELLIELLIGLAPEGPAFYPADATSDQALEIVLADLIRAAAIADLKEELPHSVAVTIDEMSAREDRKLIDIHASIIVERDSQKSILIGKRGERLKEIGSNARRDIEARLSSQIFLSLNVKVIPNWQSDTKALDRLGFTQR